MDREREVKHYIDLCRKDKMTERVIRITTIVMCILSFIGGIAVLIKSVSGNDYSNLYIFGILSLILPIALLVGCVIWISTYSSRSNDKLITSLYESNLSADEILEVGIETGTDLFSLALKVRCIKELKMDGVPEWCARDGVLPEKNKKSV